MSNDTAVVTPPIDKFFDTFRAPIPGYETNPISKAIDWILRGNSQVVFQSNWLTGIFFYIAIGYNSRVFLVAAILATFVSTLTAWVLKMDRGLIGAGLLGFCGNLVGIAIPFYLGQHSAANAEAGAGPLGDGTGFGARVVGDALQGGSAWGDWRLWLYIVLGGIMTTVFWAVLASFLAHRFVPVFTAPFVFAGWFMLLAVKHFGNGFSADCTLTMNGWTNQANIGCAAGGEPAAATFATIDWFQAFGNGIGEIWFQDNAVSGIIFLVGVLCNSRISAIMMAMGSLIGIIGGVVFGADLGTVNAGLFGYSAILTAMALGGMFFVHNAAGWLYTIFGTFMTVVAWGTVAAFMAPSGMPPFTFPFVLTSWLLVLAKPSFMAVRPIAPADATYPEDNFRRYKAGTLAPGRPEEVA